MRPYEAVAARSLELLRPVLPEDGGRILEIGCGTGALAARRG